MGLQKRVTLFDYIHIFSYNPNMPPYSPIGGFCSRLHRQHNRQTAKYRVVKIHQKRHWSARGNKSGQVCFYNLSALHMATVTKSKWEFSFVRWATSFALTQKPDWVILWNRTTIQRLAPTVHTNKPTCVFFPCTKVLCMHIYLITITWNKSKKQPLIPYLGSLITFTRASYNSLSVMVFQFNNIPMPLACTRVIVS